MAEPPSEVGALHSRMTWLSPPVPESPVGFPGTVAGMTTGDGAMTEAEVVVVGSGTDVLEVSVLTATAGSNIGVELLVPAPSPWAGLAWAGTAAAATAPV